MKVKGYAALSLLAGLAALPNQLLAQAAADQFSVAPRLSWISFDGSSALDDAAMLGLDALYFVGSSGLALGFTVDVSRPETLGDFFTPIRLDFGPESELRFVGVRTTLMQYGATTMYRVGGLGSRFAPFVAAGLGGHVIYPDNQQAEGFETVTGFNASFGGGLEFSVGEAAGFRLEVRDFVYFSWDREELNVVDESVRDDRFPEQHGNPPDAEGTIHNWRFSLSFVFVPAR